MASKPVTQAYLLALSDERALLRDMAARGDDLAIEAPAMLASAKAQQGRGYAGDMADYIRGSVDFWRNQCAKLASPATI